MEPAASSAGSGFQLTPEALRVMQEHARREYPDECCGLILRQADNPASPMRVRECANAQDAYHRLDPVAFPRTARNAYFIDPGELLAIERERSATGEAIVAIYHSHCDAEAYFSAEDVARATFKGEALYPEAAYPVLSVPGRGPIGAKIFRWRPETRQFVSDCGENALG